MAQGKQQLKFERNLCVIYRDNCDPEEQTMNGRTDNKVPCYKLCLQSQTELKRFELMAQGK